MKSIFELQAEAEKYSCNNQVDIEKPIIKAYKEGFKSGHHEAICYLMDKVQTFMESPMQDLETGRWIKLDTKDIYQIGLYLHLQDLVKEFNK